MTENKDETTSTADGGLMKQANEDPNPYGTSVDIDSGELDPDTARELTDRIRSSAMELWDLVCEAYLRRAWIALGYESWERYWSIEFGGVRVPRAERPQIVAALRARGLSFRAIAIATGVGDGTVRRTLSGAPNGAPDPAPLVTGLDGKRYQPVIEHARGDGDEQVAEVTHLALHIPRGERRPNPIGVRVDRPVMESITAAAGSASRDLRDAVRRLEQVWDERSFMLNRRRIAPLVRADMEHAVETCNRLLVSLDETL